MPGVVPDTGCNVSFVSSATNSRAIKRLAQEKPRIETHAFTILLHQVGGRRDLYMFNMYLGGGYLSIRSDLNTRFWHRRMGNINARSL